MKKSLLFLLLSLPLLLLISCKTDGGDSDQITYYKVTYNDGVDDVEISVPQDNTNYKTGDKFTVKADGLGERQGYDLLCWVDRRLPGLGRVFEGKEYSINGNITLYALWQEKAETKSKPDTIGDVVLSDGTAIAAANISKMSDKQRNMAIAVIFYIGDTDDALGKKMLGVGLIGESFGGVAAGERAWCKTSANAFSVNIDTIQCNINNESGIIKFTGDLDGSDNLEQISKFLKDKSLVDDTNIEENYPAFYWAKNYKNAKANGDTYNSKFGVAIDTHVKGTAYEDGWYLPTRAEAYFLNKNISPNNYKVVALYKSLSDYYGYNVLAYGLWNEDSWTSSQCVEDYRKDCAYTSTFYKGKGANYNLCAIRKF